MKHQLTLRRLLLYFIPLAIGFALLGTFVSSMDSEINVYAGVFGCFSVSLGVALTFYYLMEGKKGEARAVFAAVVFTVLTTLIVAMFP